jgi:hypothetical protein
MSHTSAAVAIFFHAKRKIHVDAENIKIDLIKNVKNIVFLAIAKNINQDLRTFGGGEGTCKHKKIKDDSSKIFVMISHKRVFTMRFHFIYIYVHIFAAEIISFLLRKSINVSYTYSTSTIS